MGLGNERCRTRGVGEGHYYPPYITLRSRGTRDPTELIRSEVYVVHAFAIYYNTNNSLRKR